MSDAQSKAAHRRFQQAALACCPTCDGAGVVASEAVEARARKGGVNSYLLSLEPGQLSMAERGARGGRPKEPTLKDLIDRDRDMV